VAAKIQASGTAKTRNRLMWMVGGLCALGVLYLALPASWFEVPDADAPPPSVSRKAPAASVAPAPSLDEARAAVQAAPNDYVARSRYGFALAAAGKPQEALAELKTAVRLAPESPVAHFNMGVLLLDIGQPGPADEAFCRLLEISPGDGKGHYYRGLTFVRRNLHKQAIREFKLSIALAPDLPDAYPALATELSTTQPPEETKALMAQYLQHGGDEGLANLILSRSYRDHKDHASALSYAERAYKADPNSYPLVRNLGEAYSHVMRWDEAEATLRKAIPLARNPANIYISLGLNAERAGRLPDAVEAFKQASALAPQDYPIHKHLIRVYTAVGDVAAAQKEEQIFRKQERDMHAKKLRAQQAAREAALQAGSGE
jgi:tetratricopeptide (TPR) repeat protein